MLTPIPTRFCALTLALSFAPVALAGCESAHWAKPGATTSELRRDLADCERVATGPPPFHFWALSMSYERARDRIAERKAACMTEHGWVPVGPSAPTDPSPI